MSIVLLILWCCTTLIGGSDPDLSNFLPCTTSLHSPSPWRPITLYQTTPSRLYSIRFFQLTKAHTAETSWYIWPLCYVYAQEINPFAIQIVHGCFIFSDTYASIRPCILWAAAWANTCIVWDNTNTHLNRSILHIHTNHSCACISQLLSIQLVPQVNRQLWEVMHKAARSLSDHEVYTTAAPVTCEGSSEDDSVLVGDWKFVPFHHAIGDNPWRNRY